MEISSEDKKFLELYSDSEYEKPSVTVDAVIFRLRDQEENNYRKLPQKKLEVYLTKRNYSPFKNAYSVVGTFIDLKEELEKTMKLCVLNKVKLNNFYSEQLYTFGDKGRDPRTRVLSVSYMLLTNENEKIENGEWFDIDIDSKKTTKLTENGYIIEENVKITLKNENITLENELKIDIEKNNLTEIKKISTINSHLAFDHLKLIYYATERLKNKIEWTDIIFNLLPSKFTLTELKLSYEAILNQKLLDANFRRKTSKLVSPTNDYVLGKGHRKSQLFTKNPFYSNTNLD